MWLIDQVDGLPIIGSGDCYVTRIEDTNDFYFYEKEKYFSYYFYLIKHMRPGIPAFLQYTPELMLSFFQSPALREYVTWRAQREKLLSISKFKHQIYASHFPDIKDRPLYNGFENLPEIDSKYRDLLTTRFPNSDNVVKFPYNSIVHDLTGG
jgi:hypothetical protein